jgi:ligand-binding sensor domain-containing protein/signal transduction histidine kinase
MIAYAFVKTFIASSVILPILLSLLITPGLAQNRSGSGILTVVNGKDIRFKTLTRDNGLSSGSVFGITQDDQGFLWFATGDGLSRYDGYSFRIYRFEHGNTNSLCNNSMIAICRGKGNVLWLGTTGGGVDRFDPATETFTHYRLDTANSNSLSGNNIQKSSLYEDQTGMLWIGTQDNGLNRLDPATGIFTHYHHEPNNANSLSSNGIESIYQDLDGMFWIGTMDAGLNRLEPVTGRITRYLSNPDVPNMLPDAKVNAMYEDRAGTLWVGTEKGFGTIDRSTGRFTQYIIDPNLQDAQSLNSISQFYEDSAGNFWLGTNGAGLLKFDRQKQLVVQYKHDPANPFSLRNNFVSSFWADPSGTMWVGTLGGGANMFSIITPKFAHYKHDDGNPNNVADNFILSIFEDHNGIVWIGTDRKLNRWNRQLDTWKIYRNDPANPASISNGSVTATLEDPDGTLWFGTFLGGLNRFNPHTGQFKAYRFNLNDPHSLSDDIIRSLYRDSHGVLWVGGWNNGLNCFDSSTETFKRYLHDFGNPASLGGGSVTDIYEDRNHTLWVATEGGGLNRFDKARGMFTHFQNDPLNLNSLPDNAVRVLYEDQSGQFWVGTAGGLCIFDRENGTCIIYTEKEGLPSNTIEGILEDEQGNLWISTNNGLSRFNPVTKVFRNYDILDGLQSNEFNVFTAFYKSSRTGEMYFGGVNGFNVFNPLQVKDNPFVPPIVLTDFRLFNKSMPIGGNSILQKAINETDSLTLPYKLNSLTFEFAALSFVAPEKNKYRYKLEGFDTSWHNVGSKERLAVYTNLDVGDYIFRVQGTNEDGVWNKKGKAININISLPWWGTWWFRSVSVVALLALALTIHYLRVKNIKRYNLKLKFEVAERTCELDTANEELYATNEELYATNEELATANESLQTINAKLEIANKELETFSYSVSHDLRSPLRSIDGFSLILLEDYHNKIDAKGKDYLQRIRSATIRMALLIDDMLNLSKISRSEMNTRKVNLSSLAQDITNELRESQPERDVKVIIQEGIKAIGDERLLRIVLENLIGNAWKFTSKNLTASIEFGMQYQEGIAVYFVSDNGAGFDMNYAQKLFGAFQRLHSNDEFSGSGIGLATVQRIVHRHGGEVWAEGEVKKGAKFYFTIP